MNLLQLEEGERVRAMISVEELDVPDKFVVIATKQGTVKKTELAAFKNLRRKGIIAINLEEGDDLIDAKLTDGNQEILLSSAAGMACRSRKPRSILSRDTIGVRGMELRDDDDKLATEIVAMTIVDPECDLLVITAKGMGKRSRLRFGIPGPTARVHGYRLTRRGGKGVTGDSSSSHMTASSRRSKSKPGTKSS